MGAHVPQTFSVRFDAPFPIISCLPFLQKRCAGAYRSIFRGVCKRCNARTDPQHFQPDAKCLSGWYFAILNAKIAVSYMNFFLMNSYPW